jgi:hypothetical protein
MKTMSMRKNATPVEARASVVGVRVQVSATNVKVQAVRFARLNSWDHIQF